jgi:PAS domain S-box-containing protein
MLAASDRSRPDSSSYLPYLLDTPEHPDLRRVTTLVEHLFQVPVAYMALLGADESIVARIGNGTGYASCLGGVRLDDLLGKPQLVRDSASDLPPGTDFADLRFAASAPLRSSSGMQIGVLVIADRAPRPNFSQADARILADLADVLAGKMELRMIASMALESELSLRETERRFRGIANCAPVPLMYSRADGACLFVNQAWLDFSGRKVEDELASGWIELIHPEYRDGVVEEYWRAFETLRPFTAEAPFRRHDGQYRWMLGKGAPRFRDDGSFAGYIGCLLDITDYRSIPTAGAGGTARCTCGRLYPPPPAASA